MGRLEELWEVADRAARPAESVADEIQWQEAEDEYLRALGDPTVVKALVAEVLAGRRLAAAVAELPVRTSGHPPILTSEENMVNLSFMGYESARAATDKALEGEDDS